jgi:MATE family multidrug resistance protein
MVVNIAANSVLIFGLLGFPRLEMAGAAYGTLLGSAVGVLILAAFYLGPDCRRRFATGSAWCFDRSLLGKLLRYGTPSGIELLLNITAFNVFVQMFHSYGRHVAAAITVTFNWDMVAFVPMIGVNAAAMSRVGRYMGAREPDLAERATYSCLKVAWVYAALLTVLFVLLPGPLVSVFTRGLAPADAQVVTPLATWFLRLASLYVLADATSLVFGGALRGAGDTFWAMVVSTILHWCMASSCYVLIRRVELAPKVVWTVFVLLVVCLGTVFALRFLGGHWRSIRVVGEGGDPGGPLLPALEPPTAVDPC